LNRGAESLRLFRIPSFRALWAGQLISIFGDRFTYLALLALIVERAADPANPARELSLIPLVSFLPAILFAPWFGGLVDTWNTRTTLILSDAARGLIVLAIIPAAQAGGLTAAFALVFLLYMANAFFLPARSAILPDLVPKERLVEANSLATLAGILGTIAGSLLAGWFVDRAGWQLGFALDAATYFVSVVALAMIRWSPPPYRAAPRPPREAYRALVRDVREGARIAVASASIRGSIGAMALLWIAGGALHIAAPILMERHGTGMVLGVGRLVALAAVGMVAGTLFLAWRGGRGSASSRIAVSLMGTGAAILLFAAAPWPLASDAAALLAGVFVVVLLVTTESVLQESAAVEARARIFALRDFLARLGVLLSAALFGWLVGGRLAPEGAATASGTLLVVGGAVAALRSRTNRGRLGDGGPGGPD
jgi:DHA3 family macrolide efflux protein-like MFS transporter